ncbi:DUF5719 family protein [uncultured Microbacterium sp.]|uniref:Large extracellular alpha-helical protein n=1 Tax=uncultured Microbacterium sp. TaxID=191216 RepID=A0A1Y5P6P6_9MICO|nr:DUF5719 family protein [uncultured Microbacterium sp.]SBS74365.1 Large extracellular alpha-helical protein [uncultured Microbacterium sp.]
MSISRTQRGARTAVGIAVTVAFALGATAAAVFPWPEFTRQPLSVTAIPEPEASVLACTGPLLAVGRDAGDAAAVTEAARQRVVAATGAGSEPATEATLLVPDVIDGLGPQAFTAAPKDRTRTDLAAAGSTSVSGDDLSGFAAAACTPPLMESWLVGGSAITGAADLVLLTNPGTVAARVDLTVYGAGGAVTPPSGTGIVVPAGAQRVLPLAGLALGEQSPVIRVTSAEAPVQAALQASITRTLVPGGVDQVGATSAPSESQVIPAFSVTTRPGDAGASDTTTLLRLLAPSAGAEASVTVSRVGARGAVDEPRTVTLDAGVPLELELEDLGVGAYSVHVDATGPVVAAVWETTGFGEGADFAWYTAADPLKVPSLFAVAPGTSPMLTLTNGGEADVVAEVTADAGAGGATDITVPAGGAARFALRAGTVYRLVSGGADVRANITYSGVGALAGYAVLPADAAASAIVVYTQ